MSTFFGLIELLLWEISSPALLNSLSEGTEVARVQRYLHATFEMVGYMFLLSGVTSLEIVAIKPTRHTSLSF